MRTTTPLPASSTMTFSPTSAPAPLAGGARAPRSRPRRVLAGLSLPLLAAAIAAAPAQASTASFAYTGSEQTFVVPEGVSELQVRASGGKGAVRRRAASADMGRR